MEYKLKDLLEMMRSFSRQNLFHNPVLKDIIRIVFFVVLYFIAFKISYLFPDAERILVVIWPAGGIGLAALLLSPRRLWFVILSAFFVVGNISNLMIARPLFNSVGFMIANVIESYACAWLIVRWCGEDIRFNTVKEVFALIFAATFVNAGTSFIGGGTAWLAGVSPFWSFWKSWWIADGLGILIVAPLIVTWATLRDITIRDQWKKGIEAGLFMAIWYGISQISFQVQASDDPFAAKPYLLVALLAYAAIRLGQRSVTVALSILLMISITSEAIRTGPSYLGGETMNDRLILLQVFISCIAITGYIVAASYSESKTVERISREGQSRIRALGDNIPNGMVYQVVREHDGSMSFLYLSAGVERIDGISAKEVLRDPSTIYNLFVEEDRSIVATAEEASARNMSTFNVVARMRRPDGQIRWMQLSSSPRRLEDGRILWDGIQIDITESYLAEEALKRSEEKYRTLVETIPDYVMRYDRRHRHIFANSRTFQANNLTPEEFIGKTHRELGFDPHLCDIWEKAIEKVFETGQPQVEVFEWEDASGAKRIHEWRVYPEYSPVGSIETLVGISRDITESKKVEAELKKYHEHLEELVKERTAELNNKNEELEKFNKLFVGRELRMIELKKQVEDLKQQITELNNEIQPAENSKGGLK